VWGRQLAAREVEKLRAEVARHGEFAAISEQITGISEQITGISEKIREASCRSALLVPAAQRSSAQCPRARIYRSDRR
jgi:hypothetical protein